MTLFRIALRAHRTSFIVVTVIGTLNAVGQTFGYAQLAGTTPAERAVFAQQMELLGRQLSYLLPLPAQLDSVAGFAHWRHFGNMPLLYGAWALVSATAAGRGDEERGLVALWLASGVSRLRLFASRGLAFGLACTASVVVMCAAVTFASAATGDAIAPDRLAQQGFAVVAIALCCYGLVLLVAQLVPTRRAALGAGGTLLLALFLVNSASRVARPLPLRELSPFAAYDLNTPLLRGGALDVAAVLALLVSAAALVIVAGAAFARRDLGGGLWPNVPLRPLGRARPSALLRVAVLAPLAQQRGVLLAWGAGLAIVAAFLVSLARSIVDTLTTAASSPALRVYFERAGISAYESFIGVIWLATSLLLISLFAIAQVSGWAADDDEGRLETVLAQPVSRTRVVVERVLVLLAGALITLAAGTAGALVAADRAGIPLDRGRVLLAGALQLAVVFAFGGIGAALVGWRPRAATLALATVAFVSYLTQQFGPLFDWPDAVRRASLFTLYGDPLDRPVDLAGLVTLAGLGTFGTLVALAAMRRRDVGR